MNNYGQLDAPGGPFMAVTTGAVHSCGLRPSGAVECWGNNGWAEGTPPPGVGFASCDQIGTVAGEVLVGTAVSDVICGAGGDDVIKGMGGSDWLLGEGGADVLAGSSGNDVLSGGPKGDALIGGKGSDLCLQNQGKGPLRSCEW
jgi:Ca2+-binding RTX toxin-like protein